MREYQYILSTVCKRTVYPPPYRYIPLVILNQPKYKYLYTIQSINFILTKRRTSRTLYDSRNFIQYTRVFACESWWSYTLPALIVKSLLFPDYAFLKSMMIIAGKLEMIHHLRRIQTPGSRDKAVRRWERLGKFMQNPALPILGIPTFPSGVGNGAFPSLFNMKIESPSPKSKVIVRQSKFLSVAIHSVLLLTYHSAQPFDRLLAGCSQYSFIKPLCCRTTLRLVA